MSAEKKMIQLAGKSFVILERSEYKRLTTLAKAAELPAFPPHDSQGRRPAVKYARVSIARGIIRDRVAAGLSQKELAKLAGVRVETLCRIETGKNTASVRTIEKIDRALQEANKRTTGRNAKKER